MYSQLPCAKVYEDTSVSPIVFRKLSLFQYLFAVAFSKSAHIIVL